MQLLTLASSSKGNAQLMDDGNDAWLIDGGIAMRRIIEGLAPLGVLERLRGVLVTHEHIDHIRGLGPLLRKRPLPVYASRGTLEGLLEESRLGRIDRSLLRVLPEGGMRRGGWEIRPIPLSHDAREPTGFALRNGGRQAVFLTDTGKVLPAAAEALAEAELIYIEANHDPAVLADCRYPPTLKRRIRSDRGHLSNEACGRILAERLTKRATIVLGHLSEESNRPELALATVRAHLEGSAHPEARLSVAPATVPGRLIISER